MTDTDEVTWRRSDNMVICPHCDFEHEVDLLLDNEPGSWDSWTCENCDEPFVATWKRIYITMRGEDPDEELEADISHEV